MRRKPLDMADQLRADIARRELTAYRIAKDTHPALSEPTVRRFIDGKDISLGRFGVLARYLGWELARIDGDKS